MGRICCLATMDRLMMETNPLGTAAALLGFDLAQEPLTKECGTLFDLYFNHTDILDAEVKYFLREFENRRGGEDAEALKALVRQRKVSSSYMDRVAKQDPERIDTILMSLNAAETKLRAQLSQEAEYNKKAVASMERRNSEFESEQVACSKEMEAKKRQIDLNFNAKVKELEEKYAIPPEVKERMEKKREQYQKQEME